ncbi:MAG TPA: hypothetical protein VEA17_05165, partial [Bordetella sp.]|nr:hypothetical protein [Bordetella sp.]
MAFCGVCSPVTAVATFFHHSRWTDALRFCCFVAFLLFCVLPNKRKKNNLAARHYFSLLLFYDANMTLNPRQ